MYRRRGEERGEGGREEGRGGEVGKRRERLKKLLNERNNVGYAITGAPVIRVINIRTKPMNTLQVKGDEVVELSSHSSVCLSLTVG